MGALLLAALVVLAYPAAGQARGGDNEISIQIKGEPRFFKQKAANKIKGELRSFAGGVGGRELALVASPFPYGEENVVDTTITGPNGGYSFKVAPKLNTRYQVVASESAVVASKRKKLFVYARTGSSVKTVKNRWAKGKAILRYSPNVQPNYYVGKPVFWYFRKLSQDTLRRVEKTRLKPRKGGGVRSAARVKLPQSRKGYRYQLFWCIEAPAKDVGVGNAKPARCPKKSFNVRAAGASPRAAGEPAPLSRRATARKPA